MNKLSGFIKLGLQTAIVAILLQVASVGPGYAQEFYFSGKRKTERIGFSLIKNLVVIPVYLNGKGPYNFILDTGVGQLVITDPTLIDTLNLKNKRNIKVTGYGGGEELEAYVTNDIALSTDGLLLMEVPSAILKSDIFDLSNYLGVKVHGLLGHPFFKNFIVKINYITRQVSVRLHDKPVRRSGTAVPIKVIENKPFVTASLTMDERSFPVMLVLDNGASHALSLEKYEGQKFPFPEKSIPANLGVGLGGKIDGRMGRANSLELGPFTLKNVLASFPEYEHAGARSTHKERCGNLGADFLRRFNLTFDYRNSTMYMKKNSFFRSGFEHDMSGMEVYASEGAARSYFIGRIEPGSAAEKAGFLVDDQLETVNFRQATSFSLDELTALLKSKDGKQIVFEVSRDGQKTMMVLELEQRI